MQLLHHDDLDLLMRICERTKDKQGVPYGCHYGKFMADHKWSDVRRWLDAERKKQDKRDAERLAKMEEFK